MFIIVVSSLFATSKSFKKLYTVPISAYVPPSTSVTPGILGDTSYVKVSPLETISIGKPSDSIAFLNPKHFEIVFLAVSFLCFSPWYLYNAW